MSVLECPVCQEAAYTVPSIPHKLSPRFIIVVADDGMRRALGHAARALAKSVLSQGEMMRRYRTDHVDVAAPVSAPAPAGTVGGPAVE